MTKIQKEMVWTLALIVGLVMLFLAFDSEAHHITINNDNSVTNNYYGYDQNGEPMTITEGMSSSEVAELLTVAATAGSHQFDFSTTDWQGSVVGAWYDEEDAVSFGVAKRFKESFLPNVLLHGSYTQNGSEDLVVIGGTFRF